jgi:hypothetical protein
MRVFRFQGIPDAVAYEVRATMRAPHSGHPAQRRGRLLHGDGELRGGTRLHLSRTVTPT